MITIGTSRVPESNRSSEDGIVEDIGGSLEEGRKETKLGTKEPKDQQTKHLNQECH